MLNVRVPDATDSFYVRVADTTDSVWVKLPEIGVAQDKILLVVNSDVSLSRQMADYYIEARGLNPTHLLTYALGTSDTIVGGTDGVDADTFYTNVLLPVANYIEANAIECIICSARVPIFVETKPDPTVINLAISAVLGSAVFIRDTEGGMVRGVGASAIEPQVDVIPIGDEDLWFYQPYTQNFSGSQTYLLNNLFLDFRLAPQKVIPYGRLGLPTFTAGVPIESAFETERMIEDALTLESVGDTKANEVHIGMYDRPGVESYINGYMAELIRQRCDDLAIPNKHYIRGAYDPNWPDTPPAEDYSYTDMIAGVLDETAIGMIGGAIENAAVGAPYIGSYTWVQGAWGYEATSFGMNLVANMLANGACAGVGTAIEPFATGINEMDTFFANLTKGRNICEAMYFGRTPFPWLMDAWGDPFYAPYGDKYCRPNRSDNLFSDPTFAGWGVFGQAYIRLGAVDSPGCSKSGDIVGLGPSGEDFISNIYTTTGAPGAIAHLGFWVRCTNPTPPAPGTEFIVIESTIATAGQWFVDLGLLSNGWQRLTNTHPAVEEIFPFIVNASNQVVMEWARSGGIFQCAVEVWDLHAYESLLSRDSVNWTANNATFTQGVTFGGRTDVWRIEDVGAFADIHLAGVALQSGTDYIFEADIYSTVVFSEMNVLAYKDGAYAAGSYTNTFNTEINGKWEHVALRFTALSTTGVFIFPASMSNTLYVDPKTIVLRKV